MLKIIKRNWATEQTRARAILVHSTTRYPSTAPSTKKLLGQNRRQGARKRTKLIEKLRGQHLNLKRRKLGKSATQRSSNAVRERFFQQQFVRERESESASLTALLFHWLLTFCDFNDPS